uniref:Uncharacterized protein n=1 Tax=Rhizophora mucronata TaxID=61149 RepID=A0A2P2Q814_RHIMU
MNLYTMGKWKRKGCRGT